MHTYSFDIMQLVTEIIYAIYHAVHVDRFICHYIRIQMPKILWRNNTNMNIKFLVVYFVWPSRWSTVRQDNLSPGHNCYSGNLKRQHRQSGILSPTNVKYLSGSMEILLSCSDRWIHESEGSVERCWQSKM